MDERTPLLRTNSESSAGDFSIHTRNPHLHFCTLAGIPPSNLPKDAEWAKPGKTSIYQRAKRKEASQNRTYIFTAVLTNTLLLSQIIIGALLTALGASGSPSIYVAIFGALNTVVAGIVTYLKSRGQPMRARMFRDDLERVIDQIENSETMWLGISKNMHGYSEIDIDDEVSVRSEVARLTRLYDRAVRDNTNNNPELYLNSSSSGAQNEMSGLRARPALAAPAPAAPPAADGTHAAAAAPVPVITPATDPDEAPATKAKTPDLTAPLPEDKPAEGAAGHENGSADPIPAADQNGSASKPDASKAPFEDDDEGPVTEVKPKSKEDKDKK